MIGPLFHLNPLNVSRNSMSLSDFGASLLQRSGALLEIIFADVVLTENTFIEKYIRKFKKNVKVIVRQIGIPRENIPNLLRVLNVNKDIDFLYVGGLDKLKGIEDLLKAFRAISKDHTLTIAGYGDKAWIEMLIERYNVRNVTIYTNIEEEEKFELYLKSKVYVFPSKVDGIPITFQEAWAYGCLVVTYMLPTYIDIEDKILSVPLLDIEKLREKMEYAVSHYKEYKEMLIHNYLSAVENSTEDGKVRGLDDDIKKNI